MLYILKHSKIKQFDFDEDFFKHFASFRVSKEIREVLIAYCSKEKYKRSSFIFGTMQVEYFSHAHLACVHKKSVVWSLKTEERKKEKGDTGAEGILPWVCNRGHSSRVFNLHLSPPFFISKGHPAPFLFMIFRNYPKAPFIKRITLFNY